jgi:hypothetical protein
MIDVEGLALPNVPLSNFQLIDAAKKLNLQNFRGVFLRDELPKRPKEFECGILNLDDTVGTHWCCWYKSRNGKYYFDSYGLSPPTELVRYLKSPARGRASHVGRTEGTGGVYYNSERIQPDNEVFCGHLCLYVLKKIQDGSDFQEVINTLF